MTDRILFAIAALCALVCALGLLRLISFQSRRFCPGPRLRGREWLAPFNWFSSIGCGYDLTGHLQHTKNALPITCSECGRAIERRRQMRRRPRRWRMVTVGGLCATGCSFALVQRFFAQTHWDEDLPTWALVEIENWCGDSTPIGVRKQIRRRLPTMTAEEQQALAPMFVVDLRSDVWGLTRSGARWMLQMHDSPAIRSALRTALYSDDRQQRLHAAFLLHSKRESPFPELMQATIEGLQSDVEFGARSAFYFLSLYPDESRDLLEVALTSGNAQQKQLAARILIGLDEPPTRSLLNLLIVGLTAPDLRFDGDACGLLFEEGIPRLVEYLGRHGAITREYLRERLHAEAGTARSLAACILREIDPDADQELLVALTDVLAFDRWRDDRYISRDALRRFMVYDTLDFLVERGSDAADALEKGMISPDAQQRVTCAGIAGFAELKELAAPAAPILIECLISNRIEFDAMFCTRAMVGFGEGARPFIAAARDQLDRQGNEVLIYLLDRIKGLEARLPTDTVLYAGTTNPALLDWRKLDIPRINPARTANP